ncbi:protein BLISTER isoform X2 [Andrographis paniculata]|uniref:protein BLISTER isoform X2 n=1 Tax=Andrographis paniculata TaxID=175694 RepID=UPI0021E93E11|nr:protein BLISTER isoform X2 [Andrographis paniculata]
MASAQVLRKQEHLEAGKKKLEEFRKKKAAEKAKKSSTSNLQRASDVSHFETQPSETERALNTNYNSAGTSDAHVEDHVESKTVPKLADKEYGLSIASEFRSPNDNARTSVSANNLDTNSSVQEHPHLKNEHYKGDDASVGLDRFGSTKDDAGSSAQVSSRVGNDHFLDHNVSSSGEIHPSGYTSYPLLDTHQSNNTYDREKDLSHTRAGDATAFSKAISVQNAATNFLPDKISSNSYANNLMSSSYPDMGDNRASGASGHTQNMNQSFPLPWDHRQADYDSDAQSSSNYPPPSVPAAGKRSRPSFLDSINIQKDPVSSSPPLFAAAKSDISHTKVYPVDGLGSSVSQRSANSSVASGDGVDSFNHTIENKHDFFSQKQNEDFAALEQHIEDLTQEKFSLQRALEASRTLAESLASENSTLTESFNQQGAFVNQLKSELEQLEQEINARLVELEAVKNEYANAQMECNAADERAKLLASEVIGLEEKALHLRSNELKLERQLENAQSEISSYRKKISSLERDRQDLQSTINALQEEKKLLQSKLRKTSSGENFINFNKVSNAKKDISTSTDDLESADPEYFGNPVPTDGASSSLILHESMNVNLDAQNMDAQNMAIPSDQIRMIQNINTLLAELALEKDQLVQALSEESSQNSKLLERNKELTRKLEAQTQRLELLTAKSLANDNTQPRQLDFQTMHENNITYADEGDEVVERVLGWIMKLFPGGSSSRRRPSKHL